jgi:cell wall-associated NlpC family hydrolase
MKIAQQGDLLFFGRSGHVTHVGIVVNTKNGYPVMIHSSSRKGVNETNLKTSAYWKKRFLYATKIL